MGADCTLEPISAAHTTIGEPMNRLSILVPLALIASGCASLQPTSVVEPKEVTLEQALLSIGCGLKAMDEAQGSFRTGLFPSEIEVKFALSASSVESGKLTLALADPTGALKLGGEGGQESKAERSNTITIKFTNVLGTPQTALAGAKSPEEIAKLLKTLKDAGITTFKGEHRLEIISKSYHCQ